jgi:hypothetical protein
VLKFLIDAIIYGVKVALVTYVAMAVVGFLVASCIGAML